MKKIFFACLTLLGALFVLELFSWAALSLLSEGGFSKAKYQRQQEEIIASSGMMDPRQAVRDVFMKNEIMHPYLGYVNDGPTEVDTYGFSNTVSPVQKKESGKVILAVTGGSVAYETFDYAIETLVKTLQAHEVFRDQEIVPIRLALGGFKQPQQLMTLNYFLALGGEFDILINLDGFNEAALAIADNVELGVSPFFPRKWLVRTDLLSDERLFKQVLKTYTVRQLRVRGARFALATPWRHSLTVHLVWKTGDRMMFNQLNAWERKSRERLFTAQSFVAQGPAQLYESEKALHRALVEFWAETSRQMKVLSEANGIRYFHFLQPNQYFAGSKPLSVEEKENFIKPTSRFREPVQAIYPLMIEAGEKLREQGLRFQDLSQLFANQTEMRYADDCCHFNSEGYYQIAEEIARVVIAAQPAVGSAA